MEELSEVNQASPAHILLQLWLSLSHMSLGGCLKAEHVIGLRTDSREQLATVRAM